MHWEWLQSCKLHSHGGRLRVSWVCLRLVQAFDRTYHTDAHKNIQYSGRVFTLPFSLLLNGLVALCPGRSEHLQLREPRLEIL